MTTIRNVSATANLYGTIWSDPPGDNPGAAWTLTPGQAIGPIGNPRGLPFNWVLLYPQDKSHNGQQVPWFRGRIGVNDKAAVDVPTQKISITHESISQADLDKVKAMFADNPQVQAVTLEQLHQNTVGLMRDGSNATLAPKRVCPLSALPISDCTYAKVMIVVDCAFIAIGLNGLRKLWSNVDRTWIEHIAEVLEPQMTEIDKIFMRLANPKNSFGTKATEIWKVLKLIYTAGMFEAIYKAIVQTLSWWDMLLYAALGLAELTAAFVTDGAEIIAVIAADVALAGFLVSDLAKANQECNWGIPASA
jgi:hypothetical protein